MRRVVLHIERLSLNGFEPADRHEIGRGLQQELARVFAEPAAVDPWLARAELPHFQAGGIRIPPGSAPLQVGMRAARGIQRAFKR